MQLNTQTAYGSGLTDSRNKILRNTYALLGLSMIPTLIGAVIGTNMSFMFMAASPFMSMLLMIAVVYGLMFAVQANRYSPAGVYLMLLFTFAMGVFLGPLLQYALHIPNGVNLIMVAGGATALIFLSMAGIATTTKRDLSWLQSFMTVGIIVLLVAMVASFFIRIPAFQLMVAAGFALFGSLMILQQVKAVVDGGETSYVSAALTIYVGIYTVFTRLLQILIAVSGNRR